MTPAASQGSRSGFLYAASAYLLWGALPLYFVILEPAGPFEIVAMRILFSLVFCGVLLSILRDWRGFFALFRSKRTMLFMTLAAVFIFINWQTYVIATLTGHVIEASLGYFINPIVTVLFGVVFLRERLRPLQWASVGVSGIAVLVLWVGYGNFPLIALILAFSFGLYGLMKNRVGGNVGAISGLTLETLFLAPVAAIVLVGVAATTGIVFGTAGAGNTTLLVASGIVTAVPLLLFASASRRLPLVYMGLFQYVTPLLQFLVGVFILREPMPPERWAGFLLVWAALVLLTIDMVRRARTARRRARSMA
ncbi:EamA family transporter RarD [Paramicrobacterium agarici]|uniref:Chloramphenicol-sensitive protein RarD n=1 Tax=Paramicrobacterium agarici TaxID=630514 RepID=A0A2A9E0H7_9MICO|nr:EamA family transporter RarD [Microbacterium agarici]PFG32091.1 chloramphenicol-sensitive protein RarD [Microbacterium agarici]